MLKKPYAYWAPVLLSMLLKYLYYGFRYFPVVDDNNMYGIYSLMTPLNVLRRYKMYTARPFAALLDTYVISRLWDNPAIILVLMIILHFASAFLLYKVFEKNGMKVGLLLVLFFVLNPFGTDAAYWIAASSRIVAGLFFMALSLYLIMVLCGLEEKNRTRAKAVLIGAGYFLSSLLSYGFYEQITAVGFVFSVLLIVVNLRKSSRLAMLGITFANIGMTALYYYHFRNVGTVGDRGILVQKALWKHIRLVADRCLELVPRDFLSMMKRGVVNGFDIIVRDHHWLYLLAILLISVVAAVFYTKEEMPENWKRVVTRLLTGICIIVVSYAPFYVLNLVWISNRNTFISFIGLGLILETLIYLAFRLFKGTWAAYVKGVLFAAAIFAFMLANVAEIYDYRQVSGIDRKIVGSLTEQYVGKVAGKSENIYVFNTKSLYAGTTGKHLSNCTGADWALTGAIHAISRGRVDCEWAVPVKDGFTTGVDIEKLNGSPLFGVLEDFSVCRLRMTEGSGGHRDLLQDDGKKFGELEPRDNGTVVFTRTDAGG